MIVKKLLLLCIKIYLENIIDTKENDKQKGSMIKYSVNEKSLQKDYQLYKYRETKVKEKGVFNVSDLDIIL